ncbi:MAG: thiamine pyrophosphate-dependent dehydrogenase E1 component subunit alpha [Bacteroidetes bacterium]|nr:thiamine pyrophosphate-dependent dehydrogenase E1 component subunit alpha [Bacteroidota bacterium]
MEYKELKSLYYKMLRIRLVEEKIAEIYPEQEMRCPVHLSVGQEGTAVGVCNALGENDFALSTHRSHAHYLAKGGDLKAMISELYGKVTGCCGGKGGSMHLVDPTIGFYAVPIVGSTIPIGVGIALGFKMQNKSLVSVAFFGDAATEEGVFSESLNYAALHKLPVIFICENNLYSVYSPLYVRQPQERNLIDIAKAHGVDANKCDGNDIIAVYEATKKAVEKARMGGGPTLLELSTYRYYEHCGPNFDNQLGYRTEEEFNSWKERDPLKMLALKLAADENFEFEIQQMSNLINMEIDESFTFAKSAPYPEEASLYTHLYA